MSDYEALLQFNKKSVSHEMVHFLATNTASIIQVKKGNNIVTTENGIPIEIPPLSNFIKNLVMHSNVQTPTLMATSVYLSKLRLIIPKNVYGMETTRHRIFLGCLILAAKTLNDSSPLNKHWTKYTDGLLHIREVNTIERELLEYFEWNVTITTSELIKCLSPFLQPIKEQIIKRQQQQNYMFFNAPTPGHLKEYISLTTRADSHSRSSSNVSIPSMTSMATVSTMDSIRTNRSTHNSNNNNNNKISTISESEEYSPIPTKRASNFNANPYNSPLSDKESQSSSPIKKYDVKPKVNKFQPIFTKLNTPYKSQDIPIQSTEKKTSWTSFFKP
ncbi:cyclin family protein NDAI_0A02270 [Naumovozyma dairenensis CBS 421]|uniref:Cyclin-like domain-containing protein n=1 Tax=Naumovozyma dairenensis (strain ATCC 10597 / BCRC 20456 / CBS 421 / NBRC 0211 / NRRL Y-12639) TaxID=1071378 RepID=G0W3J7_NAUDC|nr:hypothetical protein NDAI_0A02270 [Naumovozyma dairenensis CBS 421]CCD22385.1 hypothetical protein NDAI_0A02270 [Naumovozyma dairenensis CBS 421]